MAAPTTPILSAARSMLFVPGDRPERFAKALASGADMIILDLEDAVAPSAKASARDAVVTALKRLPGRRDIMIRINGAATEWYHHDLIALSGLVDAAGVMLPKAETAEQIAAVQAGYGCALPIVALVENVRGLFGLRAMLAGGAVARVAFGTVDFGVDAAIEGDGEPLDGVRTQIVLECVYAGLPAPIEGVSLTFDDPELLHEAALRSRRFGFGAKLCIHPRQVASVNRAFMPDAAAIDWAIRVTAAAGSGHGAVSVDGAMVDRPVIARARLILSKAESRPG